jgi:predicted nucleic acid-binding protein
VRTLADTNLLVRIAQPAHVQHPIALDALAVLRPTHELCIVPQVVYEFWVVCTRPVAQNGLGFDVSSTARELARARSFFVMLDDTAAVLPEWERLVTTHDVKGKNAHDARLVAAMNVHGVGCILTFNTADFARYPGINVFDPQVVAAAGAP